MLKRRSSVPQCTAAIHLRSCDPYNLRRIQGIVKWAFGPYSGVRLAEFIGMTKLTLMTKQKDAAPVVPTRDGEMACQMCGREDEHTTDCPVPFLEEWVAAEYEDTTRKER